MKSMVLDGSMTLGFLLDDERFSGALKVMKEIEAGTPTYVPSLWWTETANGLLMSERRKRSTHAGVAKALQVFLVLPVVTDSQPITATLESSLSLAREFGLTVYDATYLELALRRGSSLATADKKLGEAALSAGITVMDASG